MKTQPDQLVFQQETFVCIMQICLWYLHFEFNCALIVTPHREGNLNIRVLIYNFYHLPVWQNCLQGPTQECNKEIIILKCKFWTLRRAEQWNTTANNRQKTCGFVLTFSCFEKHVIR